LRTFHNFALPVLQVFYPIAQITGQKQQEIIIRPGTGTGTMQTMKVLSDQLDLRLAPTPSNNNIGHKPCVPALSREWSVTQPIFQTRN
jgi:hypothetical protein